MAFKQYRLSFWFISVITLVSISVVFLILSFTAKFGFLNDDIAFIFGILCIISLGSAGAITTFSLDKPFRVDKGCTIYCKKEDALMTTTKEEMQEALKNIIDALSAQVNDYEFYDKILFNGEEIMEDLFANYMRSVEGSACSRDKACFIVSRIKKALKLRCVQPLRQTYREYREAGGDLGGINEDNTDLDTPCYWSPSTLENTDQAINLYFRLLSLSSNIINYYSKLCTHARDLENALNLLSSGVTTPEGDDSLSQAYESIKRVYDDIKEGVSKCYQ